MHGGRKLDIGRPSHRNDGWETCDIRPGADHLCSATEITSLGKFDELECTMVLEHLRPWEIPLALRDWYEALNDEGVVDIVVPDLQDIIDLIPRNRTEALRRLFGGSLEQGGPDDCPEQEHRWAFDGNELWAQLYEAGFRKIQVMPAKRGHLWIRATK